MGGGVGNVIFRLSISGDQRMKHKVVLLEEPVKDHFIRKLHEAGVDTVILSNQLNIEKEIEQWDIVVVHWWHHPKTSKFLFNFPQQPTRLMIWSHISNLTVPALNPCFILAATRVIFTTEASYKAKAFDDIPIDIIRDKTGVVYGCGGLDDFPKVVCKSQTGFNIGYLGYVDFSKLHPDFVDFCDSVKIDEAKFILAGDAPAKHTIKHQWRNKRINNELEFTGYVNDIIPILSKFDVLGYPLMPFHTCTTENTVLEAMAAEVPPVLLNQLTESYIIENNRTGILVSSIEEYGQAMRYLYSNPDIRKKWVRMHENLYYKSTH